MDKEKIQKAITEIKKNSKKRNFKQSIEIIYAFKNLDLKKTDNQIDFYATLHHEKGKKVKICALVGTELATQAKESCDTTITQTEFEKQNKKTMKKLANEHDYFIAQANIMGKIATKFGKILGPRNKMPNPKAGCVIPPNANMKALVAKLQKTIRVLAKTTPMAQIMIGKEDTPDEILIANILDLDKAITSNLPSGINNIKTIYLKLTMGKPIKIN